MNMIIDFRWWLVKKLMPRSVLRGWIFDVIKEQKPPYDSSIWVAR